jgi:predicted RNA-binding Zn-ribbon protein involved in translation (DUF1610 family)
MKKCRYCDKPFEEHSASNQNDHNLWIEEEENKMKCPKCGNEMYKMQSKKDCYVCEACGESPIVRQQNPSPRDIFQHIKTECERRAFDEFMGTYDRKPWSEPFSDGALMEIKRNRPDWYSWLESKNLIPKNMNKEFLNRFMHERNLNVAKRAKEIVDWFHVNPIPKEWKDGENEF